MEAFYVELAEILEVDEVKKEDMLDDFEAWDSLGILSLMSMVDEKYGITMNNDEIKSLTTAGDIEELIKLKM